MKYFQKKFKLPLLSPAPKVVWHTRRFTPALSMARMMWLVPSALTPPCRPAPSAQNTASWFCTAFATEP
jgi:hypothetical protein